MTSKELLKRYAIKLPNDLGKPLYIQSIDVREQFYKELFKRIETLLFLMFGSSIAFIMAYSTWQTHDAWHGTIALFFSGFIFWTYVFVGSFLHVKLHIVADKGIARYTLHYTGRIVDTEIFYFSPTLQCRVKEGYVDPHSPISKKGYRVEATWFEANCTMFSISYLKNEEPLSDKEALEEAIKAFKLYTYTYKA